MSIRNLSMEEEEAIWKLRKEEKSTESLHKHCA